MTAASVQTTQLMVSCEVTESAAARLSAVLAAVPVASVILERPAGPGATPEVVGCLVAMGQKAGAAMLIAGDADLARAVRADGVHLSAGDQALDALEAARAWLGGRAIVGADAGSSRHDAMTLGEKGADYVAFGVDGDCSDGSSGRSLQRERVAWWAEIFEVPVVALDVDNAEQAGRLAAAGADFVCLRLAAGMAVAEAVAAAGEVAAALSASRVLRGAASGEA